jgi:hypothetical protein
LLHELVEAGRGTGQGQQTKRLVRPDDVGVWKSDGEKEEVARTARQRLPIAMELRSARQDVERFVFVTVPVQGSSKAGGVEELAEAPVTACDGARRLDVARLLRNQ